MFSDPQIDPHGISHMGCPWQNLENHFRYFGIRSKHVGGIPHVSVSRSPIYPPGLIEVGAAEYIDTAISERFDPVGLNDVGNTAYEP